MRAKQVIVDEYSAAWPRLFKEEAGRISASLNELQKTIEHIGSTAVPGLRAKPVIDIMIGVSS